ncbi:MAG TPA: threonine/serine exporter family protein [Spirochaetota bacterium]|nr:threonine/serine exporter family protein [Spirochaetota bacterium]
MIGPAAYAFIATLGFSILFNIRGLNIILAAFGGAAGWLAYLLSMSFPVGPIFSFFIASIVVGVYAEVMARVRSAPATTFAICAVIPLVPGGGMYYTMFESIRGNTARSLELGMETLITAGAIATGLVLVSSVTNLIVYLFTKDNSKRISL